MLQDRKPDDGTWHGALFFLEAVAVEFEGAAVLRHDADELVSGFVREFGVDFEGDGYFRADLSGQVGDDFVGDPAGVAADSGRVESDRSVESARFWFSRWRRSG